MSKNAGSTGGTSLTVSPWTLRGVIPALGRTPALRGYPGGIDAAGPGWPGLTAGGDQPDPGPASAPGGILVADGPDTRGGSGIGMNPGRGDGREAGAHGPAAGRRPAAPAGTGGRSVWQQSMSVWRDAGLEWQRLAGWEPADVDQQRTEPIPVVPAAVPPDAGLAAPPSGGPAGQAGPPVGTPGSSVGTPGRPVGTPGKSVGVPGSSVGAGQSVKAPGQSAVAPGNAGAPGSAGPGHPHKRRGGRTVLVGAVACVALLAVAVAGIVITGRLAAGPRPDRAGGGVPGRPARRWAVRRAGRSTRARRYRPRSPGWPRPAARWWRWARRPRFRFARPLVLTSPDGGRTWQSTVLRAPAGGGMPLMVAGGHGRWLAVGPDAAWTSPDGRSWRLGPGVAPLAGGDRVQALAQTRGGFAAVGENVRPVGDDLVRTPVLWTVRQRPHLAAPGRGPA